MFNNIILENFRIYSPNFSFLSLNSNFLLNISHWQYWWWFWFTFILCLYYIFFLRFIYFRTLKFYPKLTTSFRSHGKWGDLIICLLPISWCLNILINSNTLLKILEWQNDSHFFTIRVRGKQWYWIYKLDNKSLSSNLYNPLLSIKIGNSSKQFLINTNYYFYDTFWKNLSKKNVSNTFIKFENLEQPFYFDTSFFKKTNLQNIKYNYTTIKTEFNFFLKNNFFLNRKFINNIFLHKTFLKFNSENFFFKKHKNLQFLEKNKSIFYLGFDFNIFKDKQTFSNIDLPKLIERHNRDVYFFDKILKLKKIKKNIFFNKNILSFQFIKQYTKKYVDINYLVFKQKSVGSWNKVSKDFFFNSNKDYLYYDEILFNNFEFQTSYYNNNRLLKVNKIFYAPCKLNLSIITNSFDVVHSWFIPGLGLKMDAVPGRSTHHNLYVETPGLYYGQCAEICGRFHHHMPIKICFLEFEHYCLVFFHLNKSFFFYKFK